MSHRLVSERPKHILGVERVDLERGADLCSYLGFPSKPFSILGVPGSLPGSIGGFI